jgi:hypothetical protein
MRKILVFLLLAFIGIGISADKATALFNSAKVTLVVVDEDGKLLEGVDAGVGFEKDIGWSTNASAQRGLTDATGRFTASGSCNGHIGYGAKKEGYYRSHYDYDFKGLGMFGWAPWDPELRIVLRKIENPVPMYARHAKIKIPAVGKEFAFDLIEYDWVVPHGKGQHSDLILYLERRFSSRNDYEGKLTIKFQNSNDGIIKIFENFSNGSQYKLLRYASDGNFNSKFEVETSQNKSGKWVEGYRDSDSYVFRVRSEVKDGKLIKAMYGKIRGPIKLEPRIDPAVVYFTYYLNPDYTRNLEFDPKHNLFGNLPDLEQVKEP